MRLRRLQDREYDEAETRAEEAGVSLEVCPTCDSRPESADANHWGRQNGQFRYRGELFNCNCDEQIALRKHYLVANIGEQYMRLDWNDYDGPDSIKNDVALYLEKWQDFKKSGMGMEFFSKQLGTGKTFAATHVAKTLIKRKQKVYFIPFIEMVAAYESSAAEALEARMRNTTYLVLDEILPPISEKQHNFYATRLEALLRHRTNYNLPTITTTNLNEQEMLSVYPRIYSLLAPKQWRIEMTGPDKRISRIAKENVELAINGEIRPIV